MNALLSALILCLLVELGSKTPTLYRTLSDRYNASLSVICGMALAVGGNAALAAFVGYYIGQMLSPEARNLFLSLALAAAALGLMWRGKAPDPLSGWKIGGFLTSFLGLFILGLGENASFLVMGVATATAYPVLAGIGGALGSILACVTAQAISAGVTEKTMRLVNIALAMILLLVAFVIAVEALSLT